MAASKPTDALPGAQEMSSKVGRVQDSPSESLVGTNQRAAEPGLRSCSITGPADSHSGKFARPGVPPTRALARQFAAELLALNLSRLASEAPEPSAATGHGSPSP